MYEYLRGEIQFLSKQLQAIPKVELKNTFMSTYERIGTAPVI